MNVLSNERRAQVIGALIEGNSVRSTVRMTGVCKDAILKLIRDMGIACADFHNSTVRGVKTQRIQCDEVWSFCYAKAKNVPDAKKDSGAGDVWTWTAIDADSKLILSYLCGGRDAVWATQFMKDLASRVTTRIQITTDGLRAYAEAVEGAFGMDVDYAMLIKLYGAPSDRPDTRYRHAQRFTRPSAHLDQLRRAAESQHEDEHSALYPLDERFLEEIRESLPYGGDLFCVLQLLQGASNFARNACNGGWFGRPCLECK